jgi:ribosomal protein S21
MAIEVRKRDGDSANAILFNFTKRMKRSGVLKEVRKRKYHKRAISRIKRRSSAIHREEKQKDVERQRKLGLI